MTEEFLKPLNEAIAAEVALKHSYCVGVLENIRRALRDRLTTAAQDAREGAIEECALAVKHKKLHFSLTTNDSYTALTTGVTKARSAFVEAIRALKSTPPTPNDGE